MDEMGSAKKKKKAGKSKQTDVIRIRVPTAKPGSKKYTHVDWNELLRENGKQRDEDELKRFYDEDTLFMAKKLAETKSKSGKKIRVNLDEIQHMNRNCGYDMDDDFIDDTEAVDDTTFVSKKGGFYAGKGDLKAVNDDDDDDEDDEEESEEEEMILEAPSKDKKKVHSKKETKTKKNGAGGSGSKSSATGTSSDSESDRDSRPQRLTGGPPTIRMAGGPPTAKRPAPGVGRPVEKEPSTKQKKLVVPDVVNLTSTSSSTTSSGAAGDVICIDDDDDEEEEEVAQPPPAKKKMLASSRKDSEGGSKALNSSTKGSTVTVMAKKICKQQEVETNGNKPKSASSTVPTTPQKADTTPSKSTSSGASGATPTTSSTSPSAQKEQNDVIAEVTRQFERFKVLGKMYKERRMKEFDTETIQLIVRYLELMKRQKHENMNMDPLILHISSCFGVKKDEILRMVAVAVNKGLEAKRDGVKENAASSSTSSSSTPAPFAPHEQLDWQLTQKELPSMNASELQMLTTIVKSWTPKKKLPHASLTAWLKRCNSEKLTADQARVKFYDLVQNLPDVNKQDPQNGIDMPKHERSRKARMFLHQWVYLSRKHVEHILPALKRKAASADGLALKQVTAVNALKEALKKQIALFEGKKDRRPDDTVYVFQFTEPVLAAIHPYLEDLTDYALSVGKLDLVVKGIDALHQATDNKITQIQFYIEICRRLQKLSFLTVEEPMKGRLKQANEHISKHQVVQNQKYQIKWPGGEEPSLRGLNRELHDFTRSILGKANGPRLLSASSSTSNRSSLGGQKTSTTPSTLASKPTPSPATSSAPATPKSSVTLPPKPSTSSTSSKPSSGSRASEAGASTTGFKPPASSPAASISEEVSRQRQQAMHQLLQVYLGKYLLAPGNSATAELSDSKKWQLTDEILQLLVTVISAGNGGSSDLSNQVAMLKNLLANIGNDRMARCIANQKNVQSQKLTEKQYQKLFDFFGTIDKSIADREKQEKAQKLAKIQEENARKVEEKLKKEKEKQAEKERIEAKKREEKERKEREKREEKEKKEREIRETLERKRREEEDRIQAQRMLAQQEEDRRRKKEAEEAVEKELERRAKMEKEAADALQGLEEDLLMDDIDFVAEQQSKVDEERKIAEAKRAEERENQIKMMRAQQAQRQKTPPPPPVAEKSTVIQNSFPSSSTTRQEPHHPTEQPPVDILNAAQEMLGLESFEPQRAFKQEGFVPEKTEPSFERQHSQPETTRSADIKRRESMEQSSPFFESQNTNFFPTTTQPLRHMDPPPMQNFNLPSTSEAPRLQHQNFQTSQNPQMLQNNPHMNHQMEQQNQMFHQQPMLHHQNPNSMSSGNMSSSDFGQSMELREPNKRSMSMSQMTHHPHHQSPQNLQHQHHQFPSYQSPIMNNSSLMHTPLSNNSMVSQSSQFSSQPSPMSQQFHTPPSVGMMNNAGMVQSPTPYQQQHFNNFNQQQLMDQQQSMHQHVPNGMPPMMNQNQRVQQILRQQHELNMKMHQMNQINQYPPGPRQ